MRAVEVGKPLANFARLAAVLMLVLLAACGTEITIQNGLPTPTAAPAPTATPSPVPTPTEPTYSIYFGTIPFTSYYPVGFTEYVEKVIEAAGIHPTPDGMPRTQQDVVVVVLSPEGVSGETAYCTINNEGNDSAPPFDFTRYPTYGGGSISATTCFQGSRLVRVGENLYQVQVDPYGTVATVSLDDELAQSATPYLFAVGPGGYLGDQASGAITDLLAQGILTYQGIPHAAQNGPALVEGVELKPTPIEDK